MQKQLMLEGGLDVDIYFYLDIPFLLVFLIICTSFMAWIWSDPRDAGSSLHPLWVRCSGSQGVTLGTAWSLDVPSLGISVLYKVWFWCDGISVTLSDEGRCEMCEGEINAAFVTGERVHEHFLSATVTLSSVLVPGCSAWPGQSVCVCLGGGTDCWVFGSSHLIQGLKMCARVPVGVRKPFLLWSWLE